MKYGLRRWTVSVPLFPSYRFGWGLSNLTLQNIFFLSVCLSILFPLQSLLTNYLLLIKW